MDKCHIECAATKEQTPSHQQQGEKRETLVYQEFGVHTMPSMSFAADSTPRQHKYTVFNDAC